MRAHHRWRRRLLALLELQPLGRFFKGMIVEQIEREFTGFDPDERTSARLKKMHGMLEAIKTGVEGQAASTA